MNAGLVVVISAAALATVGCLIYLLSTIIRDALRGR